jgi:hypothetical protein
VASSEGKRNWLQWTEIAAISIASFLLLPLVTMGFLIPEARSMALGGLIGIAGLWLVTVPTVSVLRGHLKLRLASTLFTVPGFVVSFVSLPFPFGRGVAETLITLYLFVLPMAIALHRLYLGWKPAWGDRA